jgi:putative redox protein
MKIELKWHEKMAFTGFAGGREAKLDANPPLGQGSAPTPKEMLVMALCGCTAMDVASLMRKNKQAVSSFTVEADATSSEGAQPVVFTRVHLKFALEGAAIEPAIATEAVKLSQTRYCGVSAMLSRAFPISYEVLVNGTAVAQGEADFPVEPGE